MKGYIDGTDFYNLEAMKYYAPKAGDKNPKEDAMSKVFSGDWTGARKMDGYFCKFIKDEDGNIFVLPRNKGVNGYVDKINHVPHLHEYFNSLPNGTCILGELYFPGNEGSSVVTTCLGCLPEKAVKRQEKEKINFYPFDILAFDNESKLDDIAADRFELLEAIGQDFTNEYVQYAHYFDGEELWSYIGEVLEAGGEGAVITRKEALYNPGKRSKKDTLKIKKEITDTIDAFVIDFDPPTRISNTTDIENWMYWENIKTGEKFNAKLYFDYKRGDPIEPITKGWFNEWAGSFVFGMVDKNGKVKPVCKISGLTEEILSNFEKYKGKVAEISAMEILPTGGMRHPKFIQWRDDKTAADCKWEDTFNG